MLEVKDSLIIHQDSLLSNSRSCASWHLGKNNISLLAPRAVQKNEVLEVNGES